MSIAIITENFFRQWSPTELDLFLGGSQECVVLLAQAFQKSGRIVHVFSYSQSDEETTEIKTEIYNGVLYRDFSHFNQNYKNIILFKVNPQLADNPKCNIIYWSSDVEKKPQRSYINHFVCLTEYHKNRTNWLNASVIPHGVDFSSLRKNYVGVKEYAALYSSSFDRGVESLVNNWSIIQRTHPGLRLYITYGFQIVNKIVTGQELLKMKQNEEKLKNVCQILNIDYLGHISKNNLEKLYWRCLYWILPLNRADSELFCLNAVKAQYCGCIPVVYKIGALTETVQNYIDFDDFKKGNDKLRIEKNFTPCYDWDEIVSQFWEKILND